MIHQLNGGIADLNRADGVLFFESLADFSIDRQGFVSLPDSFSVFKEGAVFYAGMLFGAFRAHIRQMQGRVFIVSRAELQDLSVQFIEPADRRAVAKDVGQIMLLGQI